MDYNKVLDFNDKGETKLEILKFSYSWSNEAEQLERQKTVNLEETKRMGAVRGNMSRDHKAMIGAVAKKPSAMLRIKSDKTRKREMMGAIHKELMTMARKRKDGVFKGFIKKVIGMVKKRNLKEITSGEDPVELKVEHVQHGIQVQSQNLGRKIEVDDDDFNDPFVPRKLFLFNMDFFKDGSKSSMPKETVSVLDVPPRASEDNYVTEPVIEKKLLPTKRRSLGRRILKFFRLK